MKRLGFKKAPVISEEKASSSPDGGEEVQIKADDPPAKPPIDENASPLERFRFRKQHIRLSITDLLSNMWCEQQFYYVLQRGFRKTTPAMKAGTKIHKKVEAEIHTFVPVETKTTEDLWGMRIWNMLQGVFSLRDGLF